MRNQLDQHGLRLDLTRGGAYWVLLTCLIAAAVLQIAAIVAFLVGLGI